MICVGAVAESVTIALAVPIVRRDPFAATWTAVTATVIGLVSEGVVARSTVADGDSKLRPVLLPPSERTANVAVVDQAYRIVPVTPGGIVAVNDWCAPGAMVGALGLIATSGWKSVRVQRSALAAVSRSVSVAAMS